ncbi:pyridoxamine 5'-phosphate oxidase [Sneathiella chinensis]|uniref:Pyridoxine/pyridoxamine 5'-phosphate oxidase n=1 Tax=Sneathiella chinensis TaxID=349750 RepID=A0ABQ5U306_9PROT|nr:pyridoxamine 5'-phosphate oxidase [Sneathiella chinensis]GLQ06544.1 pyridoxine/pyridoxamine 5'-phosphate oxidase [Sneathiella chinensis]
MSVKQTSDLIEEFESWLKEAEKSELNDANAMSLATVNEEGQPSVRMVLLKEVDERGFTFYTNFESQKGRELLATRKAALCFHWKSLRRVVRVEGDIEVVSDEEADSYFNSRARDSRIGAWASQQSRPMEGRFTLEAAVAKYAAKYAVGTIPRPEYWSGFRVIPNRIEFWKDKPFRLHERRQYTRTEQGWTEAVLYP